METTHGSNKTLAEEIIAIVKSVSNNNPAPLKCTIVAVYDDGFVDVKTDNGDTFKFLKCVGRSDVGEGGIVVFANGESEDSVVISTDNYTRAEVDEIISGDIPLHNYYTKTEINTILSSYVTIGYANSTYALINHTHSQYITREEISDLDINISTLELVPQTENPNGVMCFQRVQKTIDDLDIDLDVDTMANGYLKIEANLIEITREVD